MDLIKINQLLQQIVREAGKFMLAGTDLSAQQKTNAKDFVTVADIKSQNIIRKALTRALPDIQVLSEEDSEATRSALYQPHFTGVVIDPIDGTYNFKRGMQESVGD